MAVGHDRIAVKRALGRYCKVDRYWKALQTDVPRIDLQGQPAGAVTEREAAYARSLVEARATTRAALPPNATPLPKESLVPAHLILTVKFSELPQPLPVQDGIKIGVQTGEGIVTAILPPKVWRTLERATQTYPQWVAALSGALERFADGEIALKHPTVQVFEKKAKPAAAPESKAPEMMASDPESAKLESAGPESTGCEGIGGEGPRPESAGRAGRETPRRGGDAEGGRRAARRAPVADAHSGDDQSERTGRASERVTSVPPAQKRAGAGRTSVVESRISAEPLEDRLERSLAACRRIPSL